MAVRILLAKTGFHEPLLHGLNFRRIISVNYAEALRRVGEGLHPMNLPQRGKFRRGLGRAAGEGVAEGEGFNKKYFHS